MPSQAKRRHEIHARRHRKIKLVQLREKFASAAGKAEKDKIAAKIRRISFYVESAGK